MRVYIRMFKAFSVNIKLKTGTNCKLKTRINITLIQYNYLI